MNKLTANLILGFVFSGFCLLLLLNYMVADSFMINMLLFISEAALIGGIADWFAVTALFRKPLGFPFHTAIIPRNRTKFIEAMANMVQRDLLSVDSIMKLIDKVNVIELIIRWIDHKKGQLLLGNLIAKYLQKIASQLDPQELALTIEKLLRNNVDKLHLSAQLIKFIQWAKNSGEQDKWLDYILAQAAVVVGKESTREAVHRLVYTALEERTRHASPFVKGFLRFGELTNSINPPEVAEALYTELVDFLENLKDVGHPMRVYLSDNLLALTYRLEYRDSLIEAIEAWKRGVLDQIPLKDLLIQAVSAALDFINKAPEAMDSNDESLLQTGDPNERSLPQTAADSTDDPAKPAPSPVIQWLVQQIETYWEQFKQDQEKKNWLEKYMKEVLVSIIQKEHDLVGQLVTETLETFNDKALNRFIEDKVGNDLQWIRINGSLVGSVVGLLLFLFVELFYSPVVAPVIRGWFIQ